MPFPNILSAPPPSLDLTQWTGAVGVSPLGVPVTITGDWYNAPVRQIVSQNDRVLAPQVVVNEEHSDDLTITELPVEQGAEITDHAYKRPAELQMQVGWSNAWLSAHPGQGSDVMALYEQVLDLQASRLPFQIFTGKRAYSNMLVASLRTHTDASLEFSFMADIGFKEVILVNTQIVVSGDVYNQHRLDDPQANAQTLPNGTVQLRPIVVDDAYLNDTITTWQPLG
jgi:hypothetical protein